MYRRIFLIVLFSLVLSACGSLPSLDLFGSDTKDVVNQARSYYDQPRRVNWQLPADESSPTIRISWEAGDGTYVSSSFTQERIRWKDAKSINEHTIKFVLDYDRLAHDSDTSQGRDGVRRLLQDPLEANELLRKYVRYVVIERYRSPATDPVDSSLVK